MLQVTMDSGPTWPAGCNPSANSICSSWVPGLLASVPCGEPWGLMEYCCFHETSHSPKLWLMRVVELHQIGRLQWHTERSVHENVPYVLSRHPPSYMRQWLLRVLGISSFVRVHVCSPARVVCSCVRIWLSSSWLRLSTTACWRTAAVSTPAA